MKVECGQVKKRGHEASRWSGSLEEEEMDVVSARFFEDRRVRTVYCLSNSPTEVGWVGRRAASNYFCNFPKTPKNPTVTLASHSDRSGVQRWQSRKRSGLLVPLLYTTSFLCSHKRGQRYELPRGKHQDPFSHTHTHTWPVADKSRHSRLFACQKVPKIWKIGWFRLYLCPKSYTGSFTQLSEEIYGMMAFARGSHQQPGG